MNHDEIRELIYRQEALEAFVHALAGQLRSLGRLSDDDVEGILDRMDELCIHSPRLDFHLDVIKGWVRSTGGSPAEIAERLIERANLRRVLFGDKPS